MFRPPFLRLAALLLIPLAVHGPLRAADEAVLDLGGLTVARTDGGYSVKGKAGGIASVGKNATNVTATDGATSTPTLDVDTTRTDFAVPGKTSVIVRFFPSHAPADTYSLRKMLAQVRIAADRPADVRLFLEGTSNGKHFYTSKDFSLSGGAADLTWSNRTGPKMEGLCVRLDCLTPAVYRISGVRLGVVPEAGIDPKKNWIINGGAEAGWADIGATSMDYRGIGGKIYEYNGTVDSAYGEWALDRAVFHGGRASFRSADAGSRISFSQVPYVPGRSACFSLWLKAAKPSTRVDLSLFITSGIAYAKSVTVGIEWKKYELLIPAWGDETPGIQRISNVNSPFGPNFEVSNPLVGAAGTVWVDDASYSVGGQASDFRDDAPVWLRGRLNEDSHCYIGNKPVVASMEIENATGQPRTVTLASDLTDFLGRAAGHADLGTFTLGPAETKAVEVPVDYPLQGPANLAITATDQATGAACRRQFFLGRIGTPGPRLDRLGVNVGTQENMEKMVPFLDAFRINSVRLWSSYHPAYEAFIGAKNVAFLHRAGLYLLFNVEFNGTAGYMVEKDLGPWQEFLKKQFAPVSGMIDCYEILNEPNIWNGRMKNPDPSRYDEMSPEVYARSLRAAVAAIREVDSNARFAGPTTCHTDVAFTDNVLKQGAGTDLDLVTEHPYRDVPELPDYEADLAALAKAIRRDAGKEIPMAASENGFNATSLPPESRIEDTMRDATAKSIRNMIIGFGNGSQRYFQFSADLWVEGSGWPLFYAGNAETHYSPAPNPILYAMRSLGDRIGTAPSAGRIKLGSDYRCYVFDRGDARVAALWKWNGDPATFDLSGLAPGTTVYDIMGNKLAAGAVPVGPYPVYLETPLPFDALQQALGRLDFTGNGPAFATSIDVLDERRFAVKVTNRVNRPIAGTVTLLGPDGAAAQQRAFDPIAAEGSASVAFDAPQPIGTRAQPVRIVTRVAQPPQSQPGDFSLRAMSCHRAAKPIRIDGDLADWPAQEPVVLTGENAVKLDPKLWTEADRAIQAEVRTAWDDDNLYVAVTVRKAAFHPATESAAALYKGDSIQVAFDPLKGAAPDAKGYSDADFEYGLGQFQGGAAVYRIHSSSAAYDSVEKPLGLLANGEVKLVVKSTPGQTVYEMAFPRLAVSPFRLVEGSSMRWDMIVNLSNGAGRMGWLELTPGIGQPEKTPGAFMDLFLLK